MQILRAAEQLPPQQTLYSSNRLPMLVTQAATGYNSSVVVDS
ncbi:hypothetical protein Ga0466249_001871 [Sporomusaceae bacterium BoRhaA]|nr:hypothetical protein [Pelorhabdus rhamnosifermentans]